MMPGRGERSGRIVKLSPLSLRILLLLLLQAARTLMVEAAEEITHVLGDPKPLVTFDSFGDNSLLLPLRCFIGSVDDRVTAKSVLHQIIDQKLREAGISMAFTQRDVHLDTDKPLDIRLVQERVEVRGPTVPFADEGKWCHPAVAISS
jgi:potassium efflux system protein